MSAPLCRWPLGSWSRKSRSYYPVVGQKLVMDQVYYKLVPPITYISFEISPLLPRPFSEVRFKYVSLVPGVAVGYKRGSPCLRKVHITGEAVPLLTVEELVLEGNDILALSSQKN